MAVAPHPVTFTVGSRRLAAFERQLETLSFTLEDALTKRLPRAMAGNPASDGLRVLSAPISMIDAITAQYPDHLLGARETYRRHFIDMRGTYDDYLRMFSGKTRSTLRRKHRKMAKACGGELDIRSYRGSDGMTEFLGHALPLSRKTYQARLLDAGLPDDAASKADMRARAAADRVRAFLLFLDGEAIAYLYLPVEGSTLVYAHLGYDPSHAALSPGTVLQMAALEELFAEQRFNHFDFTEGDGAHKQLFATGHVRCASFLLLENSWSNRALLGARDGFDAAVAGARTLAGRSGALNRMRSMLKT